MTVPMHVKRQLRQEAGFGCCVCGLPIIQYHHIISRAVDEHNRPKDMMVLCPLHHDAVTKISHDGERWEHDFEIDLCQGHTMIDHL